MRKKWFVSSVMCLMLCVALPIAAQDGGKRPLDHSDYDGWKTVRGGDVSPDGKWVLYTIAPAVGDGEVFVKSADGAKSYTIPRGSLPRFSNDSKYVVSIVVPAKADVDKAKKEKKKPEDQPKSSLTILSLDSGQATTIEKVRSLRVPAEDSGWIAYQPEPPAPAAPATGGAQRPPSNPPTEQKPPAEQKPAEQKPGPKKDHRTGSELIIRQLSSGAETKIADITDFTFSKDGTLLAYNVGSKAGDKDGSFVLDLKSNKTSTMLAGLGDYKAPVISDKTKAIAFLSNRDDYKAEQPAWTVYVFRPQDKEARPAVKEGADGIAKGWWISDRSQLSFSDSGRRLFFNTVEKPPAKTTDSEIPDDEKVTVDIWNWKDQELQPMQLLRSQLELNRTYQAMLDLGSGRVLQLETPEIREVTVGSKGDGAYALGTDGRQYRQEISWDTEYYDVYLIDLRSGDRKRILSHTADVPSMSPDGKYLLWYDGVAKAFDAIDTKDGKMVNITAGIPYPIFDELNDTPSVPNPYGGAGWLKDDKGVLLYDSYDVWLCDPTGRTQPICVTDGMGRRMETRFRYIDQDPDKSYLDSNQPLLLSAFNLKTKASGFYRDQLGSAMSPQRIIMGDERFGAPIKAERASTTLITRETFSKPRDYWVTSGNFDDLRQLSDMMPQQNKYDWGTAELVEWSSLDRIPLQGILFKPANFDRFKKYPMMVYFYERMSDSLHQYRSPGPSPDSISPSFYASRGYLVFIPDIPYKVGYPGESAVNAILPGVQMLAQKGFVDMDHVGMQGHSWGGYQVAYLVTVTNMFAAADAGAPVSNMTSAYGGIRWASGMVRAMQYEHGQSRIGGTLWDKPMQFLENSPVFHANKVQTPLLMMSNDNDGAVPWYQGIEYFTALRRLGKPVWMINYNGEGHNLAKRQNMKDYAIRMQQFFDHYLKGAPMPVWMSEGIPATKKGKSLGLEPVGKGGR